MNTVVEVKPDGKKWAVRVNGIQNGILYSTEKQAENEKTKLIERYKLTVK